MSQQYPAPPQMESSPHPQGAEAKGSGLGVVALVLGVVALVLCLIPVVNVVAAVLGAAAVVLGFVGRRGNRAGKGLAVAGLVTGVLAVVGGILSAVLYAAVFNAVDEVVTETAQDAADVAADQGVQSDESDVEALDSAEVLPIGETAPVGEYTVAVTAVDLDATKEVSAANEFNADASNQYITVDLDVVYNGDEEGDPWLDLEAVFTGADARQYDSSACEAVTAAPAIEVPTLNNSGRGSYQVCMDVPSSAIDGSTLHVEESLSFGDDKAFWAIR